MRSRGFTQTTACSCRPTANQRLARLRCGRPTTRCFKAIKLSVKFSVAEVVEMDPNWVFARTNSAWTTTINATGAKRAEANQELFIFGKGGDGSWKIARYSFSSTNPPPQP